MANKTDHLNYRPSHTTTVLAIRLGNEVYALLSRRAQKQGKVVSEYLRARVIYDTLRKHKKKEGDVQ